MPDASRHHPGELRLHPERRTQITLRPVVVVASPGIWLPLIVLQLCWLLVCHRPCQPRGLQPSPDRVTVSSGRCRRAVRMRVPNANVASVRR
jgi:hypothetical protein